MDAEQLIADGRRAYDAHDWGAAYAALHAADRESPLAPEDLIRLGLAASLAGQEDESDLQLSRACTRATQAGDLGSALWAAFWASFALANRGENAPAHGWYERARRLVETHPDRAGPDSLQRCIVQLMELLLRLRDDEAGLAEPFARVAAHAAALGECDLEALAGMGEGLSLVTAGEVSRGMHRLDEVMVAVLAGEVHPMAAGLVYCVVLEACGSTLDVRRSMQWTAALTRWCEQQPDLVPYRGQCLVHRVQVMQLRGTWRDASEEAERACSWLSRPPQPAVGAALYEWAELHRLRGELEEAEQKYVDAARWGHDPQPGLALLRLAQGRPEAAVNGLRRSLTEPAESTALPTVHAAYVEALLAVGDGTAAQEAAAELRRCTVELDVPMVGALAAHAEAQLALHQGDWATALRQGRRAWTLWHELNAPYHAARSRVLVGRACRSLGDDDAASMEFEAARTVFDDLDARPDRDAVARLLTPVPVDACPLSPREREVIGLLAQGLTNRRIASELFLSEKTVARHVSNIFGKLDVSTRTAAAAYAYAHQLA